ncbi:hypothetical protein PENTCL1PPCAC_9909, partial [Pristionchus entomophagus]
NNDVNRWQYAKEDVTKLEHIGKGSFGEVYRGILAGVRPVALKYMIVGNYIDIASFTNEVDIARQCDHENILKTIGICAEPPIIITEIMSSSLDKFLRAPRVALSTVNYLTVAKQIAAGMIYLETMSVIHRDLAARNILIGDTIDTVKVLKTIICTTLSLQISDFGLSRSILGKDYYRSGKSGFPMEWTSPEAFALGNSIAPSKFGKPGHKADVWSYGVVLWELYSDGDNPRRIYSRLTTDPGRQALYDLLTINGDRLPRPTKCPQFLYDKMLACWNIDPSARPTFQQLHDFMCDLIAFVESSADVVQDDRPSSFNISNMRGRSQPSGQNEALIPPRTDKMGEQQAAKVAIEASGQRSLKSLDGLYMCAWRGPSNTEGWYVHMKPECTITGLWYIQPHGGKVVLKGQGDKYLRADPNGGVNIGDLPQAWEMWTPVLNGDGFWSFRCAHGRWLSAHRPDGIVCTNDQTSKAERFALEWWH